jgi:hypothetical protein
MRSADERRRRALTGITDRDKEETGRSGQVTVAYRIETADTRLWYSNRDKVTFKRRSEITFKVCTHAMTLCGTVRAPKG